MAENQNEIEDVITSSIEDAETTLEPSDVLTPSPEPSGEALAAPQSPELPTGDTPAIPGAVDPATGLPAAPDAAEKSDFEKKFGIAPQALSGRENRIPYSRVVKITDKAVKEAVDARNKEIEASHVPVRHYQELDTKVRAYEGRLQQVNEFERVMVNEPYKFLRMLSELPQYSQIFNAPEGQGQSAAPSPQQPPFVSDDMPQPNQKLSDGSMVYDMDGLKSLLDWNAKNVEARVTKQVSERYAPLESDYQRYQTMQAVLPQVNSQIAEARKWPMFNENEADIVKALQQNPQINLERAYQMVVLPKFQTDRDKMRADLLREIKQAPRSTSAGTSGKPVAATPTGPRSLEQVISEAIEPLKR